MHRLIILATALTLAATPLAAQDEQLPAAEATQTTVSQLLLDGFALVDMQYLTNSIVVMLQRNEIAYFCDLTLNGETKICVRLK